MGKCWDSRQQHAPPSNHSAEQPQHQAGGGCNDQSERRRESILLVITLRQHVVVAREVSDELERRFPVPLSETNQEWLSRKGEIVEREMLDFINIAVHSQQ